MQIIRTIIWILILIALLLFSLNNWTPVEVKIWDGLVLDTKLPALVLVSFGAGLLPMWILSKAARWRLKRRINTLENTVRATTPTPMLATSTQLEAATASQSETKHES